MISSEDNGNKQAAQQLGTVGNTGGAEATIDLNIDIEQLRGVRQETDKIVDNIKMLNAKMPSVVGWFSRFGSGDKAGVGNIGGRDNKQPLADAVTMAMGDRFRVAEAFSSFKSVLSGGGGIGNSIKGFSSAAMAGGPEGAIIAAAIDKAMSGVTKAISAMDRRIDSAANYALSADRMSVLYQQMTGMTQNQVSRQYRMPLTGYRLGYGGINTLMNLQATTGINAGLQAPSVEALRTISGFSLGTGDVANMLAALGRPETVNRMFMMTGQSLYGFGGTQNNAMSVIQNIVRTAGLTNKALVNSAFQQGSVTRDRLMQMGVPTDMIDTVLQYAQQNLTYQAKGGQGMYNPAIKSQRKLMGIESNYATQAEETTRVRTARDEQFYRRQADNYADLERATQNLTKMFGALEDRLSGIIGARASTRPYQRAAGGIMKALGGIGLVMGASALTAGTGGLGLIAASGLLGGVGAALGRGLGDTISPALTTNSTSTSSYGGNPYNIYQPQSFGNQTSAFAPPVLPTAHSNPVYSSYMPLTSLDENGLPFLNVPLNEREYKRRFVTGFVGQKPTVGTIEEVMRTSSMKGLNKTFSKNLAGFLTDPRNPYAYQIGGGTRDERVQLATFKESYELVRDYSKMRPGQDWGYDRIKVNNQWWKRRDDRTTGPPVAPPGTSTHEIGMAVDLQFPESAGQKKAMEWLKTKDGQNLLSIYHLRTSGNPNDPNHIESDDILTWQYGWHALPKGTRVSWPSLNRSVRAGKGFLSLGFADRIGGKSAVDNPIVSNIAELLKFGGSTGGGHDVLSAYAQQTYVPYVAGSGDYSITDVLNLATSIGTTGDPNAPSTVPTAFEPFGYSSVVTSAGIRRLVSPRRTGSVLRQPAGSVKNITKTYAGMSIAQVLEAQRQATLKRISNSILTSNKQLGDTVPPALTAGSSYSPRQVASSSSAGSSGVGTTSIIHGGDTYHISPTIHINGNASDVSSSDLRQVANEVSKLIEQKARTASLRRS